MADSRSRAEHWEGFDFMRPDRSEGGVSLCGSCRRTRTCRLGVLTERMLDDGTLHCDVVCNDEHEGGPGVAHGGWTAAVLDEVLGHVAPFQGVMAVTGTLTVRYSKPVPVGRPLTATARVVEVVGSKWFIEGELRLLPSGTVLATAHGVWVARPHDDHFDGFHEWLAKLDSHGAEPAEAAGG